MNEVPAESVVEEPVAPLEPVEAAPEPEPDDSVLEPGDADNAIPTPDGERLVPIGALAGARKQAREIRAELANLKPQAERAQALESELAQAQAKVQAYEDLIRQHAAAQPQAQPSAPTEDEGELREIATTLDFYKTDGTLDLDRARKLSAITEKKAEKIANQRLEAEVGPMKATATQSRSNYMLERAIATEVNGQKADPTVLKTLWQRLDPSVTSTEEGAKWVFMSALGASLASAKPSAATRTATGQFAPKADPPIFTERAGGRDTPEAPKLDPADARLMKELGLDEKDYIATAARRPRR